MAKGSELSTAERLVARVCGHVWATWMLSMLVHRLRGTRQAVSALHHPTLIEKLNCVAITAFDTLGEAIISIHSFRNILAQNPSGLNIQDTNVGASHYRMFQHIRIYHFPLVRA